MTTTKTTTGRPAPWGITRPIRVVIDLDTSSAVSPPIQSVRALLKALWRSHRVRCIAVKVEGLE